MASLFDIDKAIMDWEMVVDESTGEILNYDELDNLKMAREQKVENIALYYKNLVAEAEMVKAEKNNMADRQKRLENKAESLKKYLAYALQGEKFSTPKVAVSYRKSKSVEIDDGAELPKAYVKVEEVRKPDKKMLKEALEGGEKIDGVRLVEKQNLSVK